eukprot:scaffold87655_cov35-Tisochrysis_lutea.AAC.2
MMFSRHADCAARRVWARLTSASYQGVHGEQGSLEESRVVPQRSGVAIPHQKVCATCAAY